MSSDHRRGPNWKVLGILFLLLGMPVLWIMVNKTGVHYSKKLPILFDKELDENGDTIYETIEDFRLVNQFGDSVSLETYKNKILLVNFFFASCETVCPKMMNYINQNIYHEFEKDTSIIFLSFTVDPMNDSPAVLLEYSRQLHSGDIVHEKNKHRHDHWQMLTGSRRRIYYLAEKSFRIPGASNNHQGLFHSDQIILIDKERRARGVFTTESQLDKRATIDAVRALKLEYK